MNTITKKLASLLVGLSIALLALPSQADITTTGDVFPLGLGPGDTSASPITVGGDFTTPGNGTLNINQGMVLTTPAPNPFGNIAPLPGSTGSVTITGTNGGGTVPSTWKLEGADEPVGVGGGAFLTIGRGGSGQLDVTEGGLMLIDALGANVGAANVAGMWIGREVGSVGSSLTVSGAGSEVSVVNANHTFVGLGQVVDAELNVTDNGAFIVAGNNNLISLRNGTVNINTGGQVESRILNVGANADNTATINLDGVGSTITLTGVGTADNEYGNAGGGGFLTIGGNAMTAVGIVNMTNGAEILINSGTGIASDGTPLTDGAGFSLGGNSVLGFGGQGTLNVESGSKILVSGGTEFVGIGRTEGGGGAVKMTSGSQIILENNPDSFGAFLATDADSGEAELTVDGLGSLFDAGKFLGVGVDGALANTARADVTVINDGIIKADEIAVGGGGTIMGNGTLMGDVIHNVGIISPGLSPGTLTIDGSYQLIDGTLIIEIGGLNPGEFDVLNVSGAANFTGGEIRMVVIDDFLPRTSDTIAFLVAGAVTDFENVTLEFEGVADDFEFEVNPGPDGTLEFTAMNNAKPPGTVAIDLDIKRARVELHRHHHRIHRHHRRNRDRFSVRGQFELGETSNGIDLFTEAVTVIFNGFTETLPASSFFRDDDNEGFEFINHGTSGGIKQMKIRDDGRFKVKARRLDLSGLDLTEPVPFSLQIGDDDFGTTDIPFDKKGRFPSPRH